MTYKDIYGISEYLDSNGFSGMPITIEFEVPNREFIRRMNEDLYYRLGGNVGGSDGPEECDEVSVTHKGYRFVYKYRHSDDD